MTIFLVTISCLLLFALYGALIAWYHKVWTRIPVFSPDQPGTQQPPPHTAITVLVPARNEEKNITACLDSLLRQTYPKHLFQVIIIDDHSTDKTAATVQTYSAANAMHTHPAERLNVSLILLSALTAPGRHGSAITAHKKFAIETGVHAATGDLIVTTDADCIFHPDWLRTIAAFHDNTGAKFIAAPVRIGAAYPSAAPSPAAAALIIPSSLTRPMSPASASSHTPSSAAPSFLSVFQTLDFITLQGITGAAVYKKFHSMCNGANLAYEKKAFFEVDGFRDIDAIPSGDDMLLMHKIYKKYPGQVFFCRATQAIVSTAPETSWKGFVNQRVRWASKADRYDDKRIFRVLLLVYCVNCVFWALAIASWWHSWYLTLLLLLLLLKTMVEYPFVRSVARFFGQQRLMLWFPALQPFHICYTIVIGWLGKFGSYRWKERKITT